jgi:hypothetical protein
MRLRDGRTECANCGEHLNIPSGTKPRIMLHAQSGKPTVRRIDIDGQVIHSCEIAPLFDEARQWRPQSAELRAQAQVVRDRSVQLVNDAKAAKLYSSGLQARHDAS